MKSLLNEAIHLRKNPTQYWSILVLCATAFIAILYSSAAYSEKQELIQKIKNDQLTQLKEVYSWYDSGKKGPENRPWVDVTTPFWAAWYANIHLFNEPSSLTVFATHAATPIPVSKRISVWSTPFDKDILPEIQNYELKLPVDFDFTFVWLYLMPLVLIVLFFPINGFETDYGLTPFIRVFTPNYSAWINSRVMFLTSLLVLIFSAFWLVGLIWIDWKTDLFSYVEYGLYLVMYTLFWALLLSRFCSLGKTRKEIALRMISVWIVLVIVLPSSVKVLSDPPNPATIHVELTEKTEALSDSVYSLPLVEVSKLVENELPELKDALQKLDLTKLEGYQSNGLFRTGFIFLLLKEHENAIRIVEESVKQQAIMNWINPVGFVHAHLLKLSKTDVYSLLQLRKNVLVFVRKLNKQVITDELAATHFDSKAFESYTSQKLNQP